MSNSVHIQISYSVELNGHGNLSHLDNLAFGDASTTTLMDDVQAELKSLTLDHAMRTEAVGLVNDLRASRPGPLRRAGAAALSAILGNAGCVFKTSLRGSL